METRCRVGWTSQRLSPISAVDCEVFVIVVPLLSLIFPYFYEGVAFSCLLLACFPNCSFSLLPAKGIIHVLSKTWYRIFRPTLNGKARRKRKKTAATPLRCFSCIAHVPKWNKKSIRLIVKTLSLLPSVAFSRHSASLSDWVSEYFNLRPHLALYEAQSE